MVVVVVVTGITLCFVEFADSAVIAVALLVSLCREWIVHWTSAVTFS